LSKTIQFHWGAAAFRTKPVHKGSHGPQDEKKKQFIPPLWKLRKGCEDCHDGLEKKVEGGTGEMQEPQGLLLPGEHQSQEERDSSGRRRKGR